MADQDSARRAGRAFAAYRRRRRASAHPGEDEWPEVRRAILAQGGIGPSRDWDNSSWGDLYRAGGKPPDLVAEETTIGSADHPPWGSGGDDNVMHRYLERAHAQHERILEAEKRERNEEPSPAGPQRSHAGRAHLEDRERRAHEERMSAWVRHVRAARAAEPRQPAVGFYTDDNGEVHPVTAAREAGRRYALRRGR